MKHEILKRLTIEVDGDDINKLKNALQKVNEEISKPGFRNNTITTEEAEILRELEKGMPK